MATKPQLSKNKGLPNRPFSDNQSLRIMGREIDNAEKLKKMYIQKTLQFSKPASVDLKKGTLEGVASKAVIDREGDIVELNNILVQANIPLLYIHDQYDPRNAIGKVSDISVVGDELHFKAQLDTADEYAMTILRKVEQGIIAGVSIGFKPQSWEDIEIIEDDRGYIKERRIKRIELLEISLCAVAMNPYGRVKSIDSEFDQQHDGDVFEVLKSAIENENEIKPDDIKRHVALHKAHGVLIKMSHPKYKEDKKTAEMAKKFVAEIKLQEEVKTFLKTSK